MTDIGVPGLLIAPALTISYSMTAGEFFVALGTLLLALFTVWLGWQTRASARAARAAVEAYEEPFVIGVSPPLELVVLVGTRKETQLQRPEIHRAMGDEGIVVRLRLWNIGSGPAIVEQVVLERAGEPGYVDGLAHFVPIGAGQAADVELPSSAWPLSSRAATLTITYTHANGQTYETRSDAVVDDPLVFCKTFARSRISRGARPAARSRPASPVG